MIELVEVSKRFGDTLVVDRVSLQIKEGETFVLLGGSGSGKTTTLKMINRLIEPSAGKILVGGEDVLALPPHVLRRRIGYVFQRIGLFPHMTVGENVGITCSLLNWDPQKIRTRVDELLALVELDPKAVRDRFPDALSGGQAQRVAVARALCAEPKVMLLDEPFGALDPLTRERLQQSFSRIQKELGLTAIFVTHDMMEALLLGNRIGVMKEGKLLQVGRARELLDSPADAYVSELLEAPQRHARLIEQRLLAGEAP